MRFIEKIWNQLKDPHAATLVIFYIAFVAIVTGTMILLIFVPEQTAVHYIFYVLSALSVVYFVYTVVHLLVPKVKRKIVEVMQRHKLTNGILESYGFRTIVFATVGFIVNIAYAGLQAVMGIVTHSVWNITIAAFYLVLIVMKGVILLYGKKQSDNEITQIKIYRICGWLLNLLVFAISGIIVLINNADMTFRYAGTMIFVVAMFTFYKIIASAIQLFKARKQDSLAVQAIRNINLVSALYSILVLQVAMFQAFGDSPKHFLNGITGGVIAAIIFAFSIYMIVKSNKLLKQKKELKHENQ